MHPSNKGGEKTLSLNPERTPSNVAGYSRTEKWDTKAVQQKATFHCAGTDSANSCPKAEPRGQRGLTLYTLASRFQKQKNKV
jgi:hypothetical protein